MQQTDSLNTPHRALPPRPSSSSTRKRLAPTVRLPPSPGPTATIGSAGSPRNRSSSTRPRTTRQPPPSFSQPGHPGAANLRPSTCRNPGIVFKLALQAGYPWIWVTKQVWPCDLHALASLQCRPCRAKAVWDECDQWHRAHLALLDRPSSRVGPARTSDRKDHAGGDEARAAGGTAID